MRRIMKRVRNGEEVDVVTKTRIKLLNNISFEWETSKISWDDLFKELKSHVEKFGHARVPVRFSQNKNLVLWVSRKRQQYKLLVNGIKISNKGKARVQLLNDICFE